MKLLARLLSHGFAIAVVVLLAIGFIYRGELFPDWELPDFLVLDSAKSTMDAPVAGKIEPTPIQDDWMASGSATGEQQAPEVEAAAAADAMPPVEEVVEFGDPVMTESAPADPSEVDEVAEMDEVIDVEMPVAPAIEEYMPAGEAPETTVDVIEEPVVLEVQEPIEDVMPPVPEATTDVLTETVSQDAGTAPSPVAVTSGESVVESTSVVEETDIPAAEVVTAPAVAESVVPVPSSVEPVVESEAAAQGPALQAEADGTMTYYQLLASAREAYWLRDYETAEGFYRSMIADDPDNPDAYGELANMYFSQGSWEAAASAYYEAGLRLVKSGLLAPARELVDVIRGLNGPQADALDQEIEAARGNS